MGIPMCVLKAVQNERESLERGETMRALELPPRLHLIAGWVPKGTRLADVGTDHAYLPNWLRLHGKIREAIASDLRPGPLERARNTGRLYGTDGIEYRLCSGLSGIRPSEVDTIVIAGMGGETILSILKAAPWTADGQRFYYHAGSAGAGSRHLIYGYGSQSRKGEADANTDLGRRLPFAGSFG